MKNKGGKRISKLTKKDLAILKKVFDDCCHEPKYPNFIKILSRENIVKVRK